MNEIEQKINRLEKTSLIQYEYIKALIEICLTMYIERNPDKSPEAIANGFNQKIKAACEQHPQLSELPSGDLGELLQQYLSRYDSKN